MLTLTTDLEGASEVGGLFLHPRERAGGLGLLLARSRYLFIRRHRARFSDRVIAELRGVIDEGGASPFWDAIAGRLLGFGFDEADAFNAINGHHHVADLIPKHPVYTAMLPEAARAVIGRPHPTGRAAMRMLETEGFAWDRYVDVFDGGPTLAARTDAIRTIRDAAEGPAGIGAPVADTRAIVAAGQLDMFRAAYATASAGAVVTLPAEDAAVLDIEHGEPLLHVAR